MTTEYSIQKMVSDGTLSTIALGIQYLQRNDIYMRIAGEETPQSGAPSGYTWSFVDNTTIKILPVVPNGVEVVVYRRTDADSMYNVYSQNAQFDEATIDENNTQLLFLSQEYLEQGSGIEAVEYLRSEGNVHYYRLQLYGGRYTDEFTIITQLPLGYERGAGDFVTGFTVMPGMRNVAWLNPAPSGDNNLYSWSGEVPPSGKIVPPNSTPETTGGFVNAWVPRTDETLRGELAALGGAGLVGPGVIARGADKFSIMQGRSGESRQDTLTRGLAVELNEPITGSGFAGATNTYMFNRLLIADDKVDAVNDGTAGSKVDGMIVQHNFGGPGTRGGRHAAEFMLTQKGVTESDNTDRNYVGVVGYCATNTGDGGTSDTDKKGGYFGGNFYTTIKNAPFVGHANGCESNVLIDANSSVYYRAGYSAVSGGEKQATKYDAAYAIGALGLSGAQWRDGILVGVQNGRQPVSRAIIRNESALPQSILSFSGNIPAGIVVSDTDDRFNFRVDRLEMYYTNAALSIGSKTASNTPVINAYTDASGNRAGRIIFNGDASTDGNGVCNVQFRQTTVREIVPSSPNAYSCGTASLPWSGIFTQTAPTITSDENYKTKPLAITDVMLDAASEVDWCMFQYLDRVEEKGPDKARWHFGAIAQRFVDAFQKHGLDPYRFAFICYDEWADSPEVIGEDGEVISPAVDAGSRYGIRYEQAIILKQKQIERDHKRQIDSLVARIEALEAK